MVMIQIFGTLKNFDVKTAQRWFAERRIPVQFVDLKEKEIAYYFSKENLYGIPLDSRLETSKTDWLIWTATISEDNKVLEKVIDYLFSFLRETKDRYPFPDWYNVKTAFAEMFRNRTVQGGLFMPLLKDKLTERK